MAAPLSPSAPPVRPSNISLALADPVGITPPYTSTRERKIERERERESGTIRH